MSDGVQRRKRGRPRGKAGAPRGPAGEGDTREAILRCAIDMFSQQGYKGVSVREIASATGSTLPSLYYYFGSKRALYLQACLHVFETWGRSHGAYLVRAGTPQQQLFDYVASISESLGEDRHFSTLLQREILESDIEGIRMMTDAIFATHFRLMTERCTALSPAMAPPMAAHTIYALAFGLAQLSGIAGALGVGRRIERNEALAAHALSVVLPSVRWSRYRFRRLDDAAPAQPA
jgi:AcrR family transcriptional regulator